MEQHEVLAEPDRTSNRIHIVNPHEYAQLIISRRKLERVFGQPGCLHDVQSHELFVLRNSGLPENTPALAV